jgi:hypothetical protein
LQWKQSFDKKIGRFLLIYARRKIVVRTISKKQMLCPIKNRLLHPSEYISNCECKRSIDWPVWIASMDFSQPVNLISGSVFCTYISTVESYELRSRQPGFKESQKKLIKCFWVFSLVCIPLFLMRK